MSTLPENLQLVRVTKEDFEKVMAVRKREKVYGGNDYLPSYFHRLLDLPNTMAFAVSLDGRFIAFTSAFIIDEGKTWIQRSNRVSEDYEGRGVMKWLQENVEKILLSETSVVYEASTSTRDTERTIRDINLGKSYIVADREMKDFVLEQEVVRSLIQTFRWKDNINVLNKQYVGDVLDDPEVCTRLFGKERIVVDWVPYRPIKSNLGHIMQETTSAIGSDMNNMEKALLTFGHSFEVLNGILYFIDVYGNNNDDLSQHIIKHICKSVDKSHKTISIRLFYDKRVGTDVIKRIMGDIKFTPRPLRVDGCLCVEREIIRVKDVIN